MAGLENQSQAQQDLSKGLQLRLKENEKGQVQAEGGFNERSKEIKLHLEGATEYGNQIAKDFDKPEVKPETVLGTVIEVFQKNKSKFEPSLTLPDFIKAFGGAFVKLIQKKLFESGKYGLKEEDITSSFEGKSLEALLKSQEEFEIKSGQTPEQGQGNALLGVHTDGSQTPTQQEQQENPAPVQIARPRVSSGGGNGGSTLTGPSNQIVARATPTFPPPSSDTLNGPPSTPPSAVTTSPPAQIPENPQPLGNGGIVFGSFKNSDQKLPTTTPVQPVQRFETGNTSQVNFGTVKFPERQAGLPDGDDLLKSLGANPKDPRERGIIDQRRTKVYLEQFAAKNIPPFMRNLQPVVLTGENGTQIRIKVTPDRLCLGDKEWIYPQMDGPIAQKSVRMLGMELPTKAIVNAIYAQAKHKLHMDGLVQDQSDSNYMDGNGFSLLHSQKIREQLGNQPPQGLVGGDGKVVVISSYVNRNPGKLDIYGAHTKKGEIIQNTPAHLENHKDYSQSTYGVEPMVDVMRAGKPEQWTYADALKDPELAKILNGGEGPLDLKKGYSEIS